MITYILYGLRIIGGLGLILFGLNKTFDLFSVPYKGEGLELIKLLQNVGYGYIWKIVAIIEVLAGFAFLTNTFVPLMAVVLFPVMLNAVLYHIFADFNLPGFIMAIIFLVINILLMLSNLGAYNEILKA